MVVQKRHGKCPSGTKEYLFIDRSQMSGKRIQAVICAKNDKEAIGEYNRGSYPHSLWKRIR